MVLERLSRWPGIKIAPSCPEQTVSLQCDVQDRAQTTSTEDNRAVVLANGSNELKNGGHRSNEEVTVRNTREKEEMGSQRQT